MHRYTSSQRKLACALTLALALIVTAAPVAAGAKSEAQPAEAQVVDINHADIDQLIRVPGIGEATAQRIVEFREKHGPFAHVDDLLKIKGIGEKSLEKLRPHVTVSKKG